MKNWHIVKFLATLAAGKFRGEELRRMKLPRNRKTVTTAQQKRAAKKRNNIRKRKSCRK